MRHRMSALASGLLAALLVAPAALAAQPAIYRESSTSTGISSSWSSACGFPVAFTDSYVFTVVDRGDAGYDVHYSDRRTLTGPGGSVMFSSAFSFGAGEPVESFVDENTGLYTEIYRETYRGTVTVIVPGQRGITVSSGWLYATVTIAYPDGAEPIVTIEDLELHGLEAGDFWGQASVADICAILD
jgi:hypothetical protein